jgi:hypothetical protein
MPATDGGSRDDISELSHLNRAWQNLAVEHSRTGERASPSPGEDVVHVSERPDVPGRKAGDHFRDIHAAWVPVSLLGGWLIASYAVILTGLLRRDPLRRAAKA